MTIKIGVAAGEGRVIRDRQVQAEQAHKRVQ
jgi:hypothetical protein